MTISEKSAYLKGLMDGLKLDTETNEGKMIAAIVDLLGDMSKRMVDIEDTTIAISDELDEIEEDLDAIEDFILDEDDEDDWDEDYEDYEDDEDYYDPEEEETAFEKWVGEHLGKPVPVAPLVIGHGGIGDHGPVDHSQKIQYFAGDSAPDQNDDEIGPGLLPQNIPVFQQQCFHCFSPFTRARMMSSMVGFSSWKPTGASSRRTSARTPP
jgi:hypothetical protein